MLGESWNELDGFTKRVFVAVGLGLVSVFGFGPWPAIVIFFAALLLVPDLGPVGAPAAAAKPAPAPAKAAAKPAPAKAAAAPAPAKATPAKAAAKPAAKAAPKPKPAPKAAAAGPKLKAPPASGASGEAPMLLSEPVGAADDLKLLKGVGPKLEAVLNEMGFFHFDQIAGWKPANVTWVDETLEGVNRGRASRDGWVEQAKVLATGALTDFAKRVAAGEVPTSQD